MKIIAVNGSPRKEWNTAALLKKALEGAVSQGADVELVHLYDLNYKGCISCFACKAKGGKNYGRCPVRDDLLPVLKKIEECNALIFGSPIYLATITGQMQAFLERLVFSHLKYTMPPESLFPKKIPTAFVYTMGITEEGAKEFGYAHRFGAIERLLKIIFGERNETLFCYDTYQFKDYSKVVAPRFDSQAKLKRRREIFPQDCQRAFDLGARLAGLQIC